MLDEGNPYPSKSAILQFLTEHVQRCWPDFTSNSSLCEVYQPKLSQYTSDTQVLDIGIRDIETLLTEIERALERITCKARRFRNRRCAINRLPVELLCEIFSLADNGDINTKLSISQVCEWWRTTSLLHRALWTKLDLANVSRPLYIDDILARAEGLPLSLIYRSWPCNDAEKAGKCAAHLQSAEAMDLRIDMRYIHDQGTRLWLTDSPAPMLRRLQLEIVGATAPATIRPLFANKYPCMTELSLLNCQLDWSPTLHVGLTKLKIHYRWPSDLRFSGTGNDFRNVLEDCPQLEELELINCGPLIDIDPSQRPHRALIPLPQLRKASLCLHTTDLDYLLSIVSLPSSVHLVMACDTRGPLTHLLRLKNNPLSLRCLTRVRSLEIDSDTHRLRGYWSENQAEAPFELAFRGENSTDVMRDLLGTLGAHFEMPLVCKVRLRSLTNVDPNLNIGHNLCLLQTQTVTQLELVSHVAGTVALALQSESATPFCPNLDTLVLDSAYLSGRTLEQLAELLWIFHRLTHLVLRQCTTELPPDEAAQSLRHTFGTVEWPDRLAG